MNKNKFFVSSKLINTNSNFFYHYNQKFKNIL